MISPAAQNFLFQTDSSRWAALQTRNPLAAASFVYCVTSTKICCRPTCKARLARRSNVIFHNTYADASTAGFRACKRCRPELLTEYDPQADVVARACRAIEDAERAAAAAAADADDDEEEERGRAKSGRLRLEDLAREAGLTKSHFHRVFKKVTGVTPRIFAVNVRVERMLDGGEMGVEDTPELVESAGLSLEGRDGVTTPGPPFAESGRAGGEDFARPELQALGFDSCTQTDDSCPRSGFPVAAEENWGFKKKIEYIIQPWASGYVLVAATSYGVCRLEAGHSVSELSQSLANEFPLADLEMSKWPTDADPGKIQNGKYGMFATVMEALVRPTGKVLNVPFDIS